MANRDVKTDPYNLGSASTTVTSHRKYTFITQQQDPQSTNEVFSCLHTSQRLHKLTDVELLHQAWTVDEQFHQSSHSVSEFNHS